MTRILVAGLGNIFRGDDGFGVEVAQRLRERPRRDGVDIGDFGISGLDLAYALVEGYDAAILVDAARRGLAPGTIFVIEPQRHAQGTTEPHDLVIEPHDLDPAKMLRMVELSGGVCPPVLIVACEPETLGDEATGAMGLSPRVAASIDAAVATVERLVEDLSREVPRV